MKQPLRLLAFSALCLLPAKQALAACSNPAREEGAIIYNADCKVPQFCDGTSWVSLSYSGPCVPTTTCPSSGLTGHWKLDESGNVSTAADSAGTNDGTLTNFPADPSANWVTGQLGNALDFDGTDDYVNAGSDPVFDLSTGNISLWFNTPSSRTGTQAMIGKDQSGGHAGDSSVSIIGTNDPGDQTSDDLIRLRIENGSGLQKDIYSDTTVAFGEWVHVSVNFGTGGMEMYVNGVPQADTDANTYGWLNTAASLTIGAGFATSARFDGLIDDIRVYDHALSQTEIDDLYNGGAGCQ